MNDVLLVIGPTESDFLTGLVNMPVSATEKCSS